MFEFSLTTIEVFPHIFQRNKSYRITTRYTTVKHVYINHPRDVKKWSFDRGALIKMRFILVVVKAGLTVLK